MKPDSDLDREIQALLQVDPSPEFTARVRSRIEKAPAPTWRFGWTVFAAGAMAAAIVLAVAISRPHDAVRTAVPDPLPATTQLIPAPNVPAATFSSVPAKEHVEASVKLTRKEPEFFISPGEAEAMQRLLRGGFIQQVEISEITITPEPLPEMTVTPISLFDPFSTAASLPITPLKGDIQ